MAICRRIGSRAFHFQNFQNSFTLAPPPYGLASKTIEFYSIVVSNILPCFTTTVTLYIASQRIYGIQWRNYNYETILYWNCFIIIIMSNRNIGERIRITSEGIYSKFRYAYWEGFVTPLLPDRWIISQISKTLSFLILIFQSSPLTRWVWTESGQAFLS